MEGWFLRFYVRENERVDGALAWEWLLEQANALGVRGGSAFRAMAGFGRDHVLHESSFFELAGSLAIEVQFVVTDEEAGKLMDLLKRERLALFYVRTRAQFGVIEPASGD
ncbi:MAG: DUF190 domain-containing protein [Gammaproteobacteria bacterium]